MFLPSLVSLVALCCEAVQGPGFVVSVGSPSWPKMAAPVPITIWPLAAPRRKIKGLIRRVHTSLR